MFSLGFLIAKRLVSNEVLMCLLVLLFHTVQFSECEKSGDANINSTLASQIYPSVATTPAISTTEYPQNFTTSSVVTSSLDVSEEATLWNERNVGYVSTSIFETTAGRSVFPDFSEFHINSTIYPTVTKPMFRPVFSSIKNGERHVYPYTLDMDLLSRWPAFQLEIYAESYDNGSDRVDLENYPLHVIVYWHASIKSWDIPINYINDSVANSRIDRYANHSIGKTIWLYPKRNFTNSTKMTIEVSIVNDVTVYYKIRIVSLKQFQVPNGEFVVSVTTTHAAPTFYKFDIPKGWDNVFIHAVSESDICTVLTIQQPMGPFIDVDDNSKKRKFKETFTQRAGLTVDTKEFPQGFLLVNFLPLLNDTVCKKSLLDNETDLPANPFRVKSIHFRISMGIASPGDAYFFPILVPILVYLICATISVGAYWYFHRLRIKMNKPKTRRSTLSLSQRIKRMKCCCQSNLSLNELIVADPSRVVNQGYRYCSAGFVMSAFYCVPVFQLIITFKKQLEQSGDYDICYFNHYCSHMSLILGLYDFNHVYSNIWYVLFGLLFTGMVTIRRWTNHQPKAPDVEGAQANEEVHQKDHIFKRMVFYVFPKIDAEMKTGVMPQYGLLLCIGYAMIMTGVMSAGYHVCPNQSNFQFDTIFMYTIAAITVVTIYQYRHPVYLSANFVFIALAMVTCVTVLGLLWEKHWVKSAFSAVHMIFLLISLPKMYFNGYIRKNGKLVVHWIDMMKIVKLKLKDDWVNNRPFYKKQLRLWECPDDPNIQIVSGGGKKCLPLFFLGLNTLTIIAIWTGLSGANFATQVLFVCVMNGGIYTLLYCALKIYHLEGFCILWIQPCTYLAASLLLWTFGLREFSNIVSTWESSPAESRLKNKECSLFRFYDSHDLWHFYSAAALYCSAMLLLTVDDDLLDRHKADIPVF